MHLPIDQFDAFLGQVISMLEREANAITRSSGGSVDHRAFVEREMKRRYG